MSKARPVGMTARRLFVVLALLWASAAASEEDCSGALATLRKERNALSASLDSQKENVQSLTSTLKEKEASILKLSSEVETLNEKGAKCTTELKEKIVGLDQCDNKLQTKSAECEKCNSELQTKSTEGSKCETEFKICKGAEKQLQVELANSFARVQVLSAEITQLTKRADKLKGQVEEKDRALTALQKRALLTEAELQFLKDKAAASSVNAFLSQVSNFSLELLITLNPYWRSLMLYIQPLIQSILNSPLTVQAIEACKEAFQQAKELAAKLYADAKPFWNQISEPCAKYASIGLEKINTGYATVKPMLLNSFTAAKVYAGEAFQLTQRLFLATVSFVVDTSRAIAESPQVAEIKRISTETVDELEVYLQVQMQQIASLQPFAKMEYVRFIIYSMLALPPLFVIGLLYTCLSGSNSAGGRAESKKRAPPVAASSSAAAPASSSETAQKKGKRKKNKQQASS